MTTKEIKEDNARQLNDEARRLRDLCADIGERLVAKDAALLAAFNALNQGDLFTVRETLTQAVGR